MSPVIQPLPCIVCGFQPRRAFGDHGDDQTHRVPYAATMFNAGTGHYGSTVWDEMSPYRSLSINVCDECLVAGKERVAVVDSIPQPSKVTYEPWEGPWTGDDNE